MDEGHFSFFQMIRMKYSLDKHNQLALGLNCPPTFIFSKLQKKFEGKMIEMFSNIGDI